MTILDSYIGQALHHFQLRKLEIEPQKIKNYSKVDEGITECLKGKDFPKELDKLRIKINHFRTLRNQFSHYKIGVFSFNAKQESFESFLKELEGIDLKESFHCFIDGKAGVLLPYSLSSGKFLETFLQESDTFMKALVEYLFPTEENKIFDFANK